MACWRNSRQSLKARISEDDYQEGDDELTVFLSVTAVVEAGPIEAARAIPIPQTMLNELADHLILEGDEEINVGRENNWTALSADAAQFFRPAQSSANIRKLRL